MAEIRWTEEAANWLRDIYEYISEDNPKAAQKVVEGIVDKTKILETFPKSGHRYREEPDGEIRIILYGHYRIAYIIKIDTVEILGVFHGALEMGRYVEKYIKQ